MTRHIPVALHLDLLSAPEDVIAAVAVVEEQIDRTTQTQARCLMRLALRRFQGMEKFDTIYLLEHPESDRGGSLAQPQLLSVA